MSPAKNLIVALVTAPELLLALIVYALWLYRPEIFTFIGSNLKSDEEVWKYLNVLPIALIAACFRLAAKVRAPLEREQNKKLYEWPEYRLLVARVNLALVFGTGAAIAQVALWMFGKQLSEDSIGVIFIASTVILSVITAGLTLASMKIGEILTQHG